MECAHNPRNSRTVPIERLSLAERALLLTGASSWTTHAVPRAGIPAMTLSDGPHGLRRETDGGTADGTPRATGAVSEAAGGAAPGDPAAASSLPATCFPTASVAACSWDPALAGRMGQALSEEARAQGVNVLLGPGLNVKRSPLCGRNFEYYAEDPLLAGRMAAGFVRGVQSQGVAACPKHFAANGQELRRQASDSVVDERTLRELYLTAFEIAVREGRPWALMSSYNLVNGTYAHENRHLLTDILRREWGFDGMVVSDWGASNSAVAAVAAGGSLEMPCPGLASVREIVAAVRSGRLRERDLNERAREVALCARRTAGSAAWPEHQESRRAGQIVQSVQPAHGLVQLGPIMRFLASKTAVFSHDRSNLRLEAHRLDRLEHEELAERAGLADRAEYAAERAGSHGRLPAAMIDRHDDLAREVAEQAMVLLRNDRDILPLRAGTRIALIGDMAAHPRFQGSGSSKVNATRVTSLCEAIRAERGLELAGYAPGYRHDGVPSVGLLERARTLAVRGDVDAVVVCVGLDDRTEAEGLDRESLAMPATHLALMDALTQVCARAGKPLIVVLAAGSPVAMPWLDAYGCEAPGGCGERDEHGDRAEWNGSAGCAGRGARDGRAECDGRAGRTGLGEREDRAGCGERDGEGTPGGCMAVLYAGLAGQAGGSAVARILSGAVNPSGRLAETWPLQDRDCPTYGHYPASGRHAVYREGPLVGYRHYVTAGVPVRYPFGFGLSYTTFRYADLAIDANGVSFTLANTGSVAGAEVAQLYVSGPCGDDAVERAPRAAGVDDRAREQSVQRDDPDGCGVDGCGVDGRAPGGETSACTAAYVACELKGFVKVRLEAGESRRVTIPFDRYTFRHWERHRQSDSGQAERSGQTGRGRSTGQAGQTGQTGLAGSAGRWAVDPGEWMLWVGRDCITPCLAGTVALGTDGTVQGGRSAPVGSPDDAVSPGDAVVPGNAVVPASVVSPGSAVLPGNTGSRASAVCPIVGHGSVSSASARLAAVRAETARALQDVGATGVDAPAVPFTENDPFSSWIDSRSPIARRWAQYLIRAERRARERAGTPDLGALFRLNMPPRALAKLSGGKVAPAAAHALADIANGHTLRGAVRFAANVACGRAADLRTRAELRRHGAFRRRR